MDIKEAWEIIGGLSRPSKMPCFGYSIPAIHCKTGAKLRKIAGSICSVCYALKGRYSFPKVRNAMQKRFASLNHPQWVQAMVLAIKWHENSGFFRWHDSGDIQSVNHLERIVEVCKQTPAIRHWLPTREFGIVKRYLDGGNKFPSNLTVRLSAIMIDGPGPHEIAKRYGLTTSGVSVGSFTCPSSLQQGKCAECRACWDSKVENVNYKRH